MRKAVVLDMDGTLCNIYGYNGWKHCLDVTMDTAPYEEAEPLVNTRRLNYVLSLLRLQGWTVIVNSWLSKNDNQDFHKRIVKAKQEWLKKYRIVYDYAVFTKYGVDKSDCIKDFDIAVLVDDNNEVRQNFKGYAISEKNLVDNLAMLLERAPEREIL